MPPDPPPGAARPKARPDYLGLGLLVAVVLVIVALWWVFPWIQRIVSYQDCIATGRITGC